MDENFQTYLNRAMRLTLAETYRSQVQHIQESAKFRPDSEKGRLPTSFPGYTIITPPANEEMENRALYEALASYQQQITDTVGEDVLVPVPPSSFHLTLADLIWDGAYRHAAESPEFEGQLQQCIRQIFYQSQPIAEGKPVQFQVIGLMVMTRAIAVCLVPAEEYAYNRLLKFRRTVYQNEDLIRLGIEQQYYFTPHITLGYFGNIPTGEALAKLGDRFVGLNQSWLDQASHTFAVRRAELRKFDDMTRYYRQPEWAAFEF